MSTRSEQLRTVTNFDELVRYLEEELDWPLQEYGFDELTFEYLPEELGLKEEDAAKVRRIHQLRPLRHGQPWGIFFVEFERKRLPVVVMRRILSHLVVKKRAGANRANAAAWDAADLLFISAFGEERTDQREVAFAHFHQEAGDLPTLRVLGWDGADTPLKLEHVAATLRQRLRWPDDPTDNDAWRSQWSGAFQHRLGHIIRTADALAERLAGLARNIRAAALTLLELESEAGRLRQLHSAFQTALIHDLSESDFADTYAQTITYGLLTAAISRTEMSEGRYGTVLLPQDMAEIVPVTNPFLREMLQTFLKAGGRQGGIDFDELGIQDVVALLRGDETDLPAVLRDFGNRTQGEDPVIHFYEHFLAAYDKQLKVQRGVFYTPKPVVSYIVRSVHELLQSEFGLADGLADTATWGEMAARLPDLKIPEGTSADSPFVTILDPATGTATFLVEVIDVIHRALSEKWRQAGLNEAQRKTAWNEYVPAQLLPRLHGYELMMAPYAIAHMKIGLKLHETGYRFASDQRVRVYLTNALEPADDLQKGFEGILPALAHEAQAVNRVKREQRFTVVMGNPPYSNFGQLNRIPFILDLLSDYKRGLNEKKLNLDDDFIKFIRFAHFEVSRSQRGIIGLITNNTYFDGITHRNMRRNLLQSFDKIYVFNLHGSVSKRDNLIESGVDKNVFDIQQGVGITILLATNAQQNSQIYYTSLLDNRDAKYRKLQRNQIANTNWAELRPESPYYFFALKDLSLSNEYSNYWGIVDIFQQSGTGVKTERDGVTIHWSRAELQKTVKSFQELPETELRRIFKLGSDSRDWKIVNAKNDVIENDTPERYMQILYRPFDSRHIWYDGKTRGFVGTPSYPTMRHMMNGSNIALLAKRQSKREPFSYIWCARGLIESCVFESAYANNSVFPLRIYEEHSQQYLFADAESQSNLVDAFVNQIFNQLGFVQTDSSEATAEFESEGIFGYIYAILHSPTYRDRYAEFLKIDFPRIPLPASRELFQALARLGGQLVALHLVEFALDDEAGAPADWPRYPRLAHFRGGDPSVAKFPSAARAWADGYVAINGSSGFAGVPEEVWNFQVGGYQVCHKWLKDRKDRTLSDEDILHYAKIVTALHETIRLMEEIDEVIDEHGGWPDAFSADSGT